MADQIDKQGFSSRAIEYAIYGKNKARDFIYKASYILKDRSFMLSNYVCGEMT